MAESRVLCRMVDLADGQSRGFDPQGTGRDTMFIVRQGRVLHAWHDRCPHEGDTPLPWQRHAYLNAARTRIVCGAHGAQFDIASGRCLLGPCLGQSLDPVAVHVTDDGLVRLGAAPASPSREMS